MNAQELAAIMEAEGFRIFPIEGKTPAEGVSGFGAERPDATWGAEWFGDADAVAVLCGPCPALENGEWLLGLDLDGDWRSVDILREFVESLPGTLESHGGNHLFFAVPDCPERLGLKQWTDVLGTKKEHGAALDLRWAGGYMAERLDWADDIDPTEGLAGYVDLLPEAALGRLLEAGQKRRTAPSGAATGVPSMVGEAPEWFDGELASLDAGVWLRSPACASAVSGEGGHNAAMVVVGALWVGFGLPDEDAWPLLEEWNETKCDPSWSVDELQHKVDEIDRGGSETWQEFELAKMYHDKRAMAPGPLEASGGEGPASAPDSEDAPVPAQLPSVPAREAAPKDALGWEREDASQLVLCPLTGWPYLLQQGQTYWAHSVGRAAYGQGFPQAELRVRVNRQLFNQIPETHRKKSLLEDAYIRTVDRVRHSYTVRENVYAPARNELSLAALDWYCGGARFHGPVDEWLRALFGEDYPKAIQWFCSLMHLDRPAPCLYLVGPPGVGKGLLGDGLAGLWGQKRPGSLRSMMTDFNSFLATCPLVFCDEGFPEGMSFDWFREVITSHTQEINMKNVQKFPLEGCARFIIAANDDQGLRFQRTGTLSQAGIAAIGERLLVLRLRAEGREAVGKLDTAKAASYQIAEHVRFLAQTTAMESASQRMATVSGGGEELLEEVSTNRYATILLFLSDYLPGEDRAVQDEYQDSRTTFLQVGEDGAADVPGNVIAVSSKYMLQAMHREETPALKRISAGDLKAFFSTYRIDGQSHRYKVGGRRMSMVHLDRDAITRAIERLI